MMVISGHDGGYDGYNILFDYETAQMTNVSVVNIQITINANVSLPRQGLK